MRSDYRTWLGQQNYQPKTIRNYVTEARRVEKYHGDLDGHYTTDRMASLFETLRYSIYDEGHHRPNPSRIPIKGDIRTNLASYNSAMYRYLKFRNVGEASAA